MYKKLVYFTFVVVSFFLFISINVLRARTYKDPVSELLSNIGIQGLTVESGHKAQTWMSLEASVIRNREIQSGNEQLYVIYVRADAPAGGDGLSWSNALNSLQGGIDAAVSTQAEVWVAAGRYYENILLKEGISLYGGFSGVETSREQRNYTTNISIIDGTGQNLPTVTGAHNALIDGFEITNGHSDRGGGIFCPMDISFSVYHNNIHHNVSSIWGGGLFLGKDSVIDLIGNRIEENDAPFGGGIFADTNSYSKIKDNIIENNNAKYKDPNQQEGGFGGGIYLYQSSCDISENSISNNIAQNNGGGIYTAYVNASILDNEINGNRAKWSGAGILEYVSSSYIENNTIHSNIADLSGGGIYIYDDSTSKILRNTIYKNVALSGGGIFVSRGSVPIIESNIIRANIARFDAGQGGIGGGVYSYFVDSSSNPLKIRKNIFEYNQSFWGGALFFYGCKGVEVSNNLIIENEAEQNGGALFCKDKTSSHFINNTLYMNYAPNDGSSFSIWDTSIVDITNSIIWDTRITAPFLIDTASNPICSVTYTDTYNWDESGIGNINADPQFMDPNEGDFHIDSNSPCQDAGNPYILYDDIDGSLNDMGAYGGQDPFSLVERQNYTFFGQAFTCKAVQSEEPRDYIDATDQFDLSKDEAVHVWVEVNNVYVPLQLKWEWYKSDDSFIEVETSEWSDDPNASSKAYWSRMRFTSMHKLSDLTANTGYYCKVYIDDGDGFILVAIRYFNVVDDLCLLKAAITATGQEIGNSDNVSTIYIGLDINGVNYPYLGPPSDYTVDMELSGGLLYDYRQIGSNREEWLLIVRVGDNADPNQKDFFPVLSWDPGSFCPQGMNFGNLRLYSQDPNGGRSLLIEDMNLITQYQTKKEDAQCTVDLKSCTFHYIIVWSKKLSKEIDLPKGWSMISLPIIPDDATLSALFPQAVVVYKYERENGYVRVKGNECLNIGRGYWILIDQNQTYTLIGQAFQSHTLPVYESGWEMIGGCSFAAQASTTNGTIKVIYYYVQKAGYQRLLGTENLLPGKGYWILFNNVMEQAVLTVETLKGNYPPVITGIPITKAQEAQLYQYNVEANDPEGTILTFLLDQSPAGMTIDPYTGLINWIPGRSQAGPNDITVRVQDVHMASTTLFFRIIVSPRSNTAPIADPGGPYSGFTGETITFDGSGSLDPEGDPILDYHWVFGDGNDAYGVQADHTYTAAGIYTITLYVTDDRGATGDEETTCQIGLTGPPPPPRIEVPREDDIFRTNESLTVSGTVSPGVVIVHVTVNGPPPITAAPSGTIFNVPVPTPHPEGVLLIEVVAEDSLGRTSLASTVDPITWD